ncbi:protein CURVATURE THYLAKOID 1A, chloroplastic-like isoform X1 [Rhododendron vialii]|uniref:protein CURVATURE THYLAKOID 1A, chloroplastic-like isoform X1 n=1 Tax=Rhododendron vialii TaxID=182163 RepID=UPI0026604FFE|nr:protein CURVATURE THYLAKOID 1A, chloroplastic-like isoform X1 [Rhododendron vialii]
MAQAYAAARVSSMAVPRLSKKSKSLYSQVPALPYVSPRSASSSSTSASASASFKHSSGSNRLTLFQIKASSSEESSGSTEVGEGFSDLKEKWDALEDKYMLILYGGGPIVALWLSSIVVDAINSVPLLPRITELVGLGYTGWFVYRYLLFKSSRKELAAEIEALKKKIAGS